MWPQRTHHPIAAIWRATPTYGFDIYWRSGPAKLYTKAPAWFRFLTTTVLTWQWMKQEDYLKGWRDVLG